MEAMTESHEPHQVAEEHVALPGPPIFGTCADLLKGGDDVEIPPAFDVDLAATALRDRQRVLQWQC